METYEYRIAERNENGVIWWYCEHTLLAHDKADATIKLAKQMADDYGLIINEDFEIIYLRIKNEN